MSRVFDRFMVDVKAAGNPKVKRLKRAGKDVRWAWFHGVLAIAATAPMRGSFCVGSLTADEHDVADVADVTITEARKALEVARELGLLERDDHGVEWVHHFEEYNPEPKRDNTAPERAKRYRERQRTGRDDAVTSRRDDRDANGTVTPPEVEVEVEDSSLRSEDGRDGVAAVWAAYDETRRLVLGENRAAKLTAARRQLVARRLKDWPLDDLVDAVRGWQHSPHNRGENDRDTPFCDLELLLRDAGHIERFRDLQRNPPRVLRPAGPAGADAEMDAFREHTRRMAAQVAAEEHSA